MFMAAHSSRKPLLIAVSVAFLVLGVLVGAALA